MFSRKKKEPELSLRIIFKDENLRQDTQTMKITDLPIKETVIIRKCVNLYDDPDPCYIRRGAIYARIYEEIRVLISAFAEEGRDTVVYEDIPDLLEEYLAFEGPYKIQIIGWEERRSTKPLFLLITFLLLLRFPQIAEAGNPTEIYYFYFNACASCNEDQEFREKFYNTVKEEAPNKEYTLLTYNVFKGDARYFEICEKKHIESLTEWPVLIIGNQALYGKAAIEENMLDVFVSYQEHNKAGISVYTGVGIGFIMLTAFALLYKWKSNVTGK